MNEEEKVSKAVEEIKGADEEQLEKVIKDHFERVRTQGLHIGSSFISSAVYAAIEKNLKNGMNSSLRDFQRATKEVLKIISPQITQQNDLQEAES